MKFFDYMKSAFMNPYNLLLYGSAMAFAIMSGAILPGFALFTAIELAFLTIVAMNPRYQRAIDAISNSEQAEQAQKDRDRKLGPILANLRATDRRRFDDLCDKCKSLQQNILMNDSSGINDVTDAQTNDVNKLLWIFLKILVAKNTVISFVERVSEENLRKEVSKYEDRLAKIGGSGDKLGESPLAKQKRITMEDMLRTAQKRLDNFVLTKGNIEIFDLRLEQIEQKLSALSELALNRHDTTGIAASIDSIANDVEISENTINDLRDATGLSLKFDEAPSILSAEAAVEDRGSRGRGRIRI